MDTTLEKFKSFKPVEQLSASNIQRRKQYGKQLLSHFIDFYSHEKPYHSALNPLCSLTEQQRIEQFKKLLHFTRVTNDELIYNMANRMSLKPSTISSYETGREPLTIDFIMLFEKGYYA